MGLSHVERLTDLMNPTRRSLSITSFTFTRSWGSFDNGVTVRVWHLASDGFDVGNSENLSRSYRYKTK